MNIITVLIVACDQCNNIISEHAYSMRKPEEIKLEFPCDLYLSPTGTK